jgi:phospholipid transport system transporter-binding protein
MKVNIQELDTQVVIEVLGELDRTTISDNLWATLSAVQQAVVSKAKRVQIDLVKVKRADTAGLAWLINAIRDIPLDAKQVEVTHVPKKLLDLAKLSNADKFISAKEKSDDE